MLVAVLRFKAEAKDHASWGHLDRKVNKGEACGCHHGRMSVFQNRFDTIYITLIEASCCRVLIMSSAATAKFSATMSVFGRRNNVVPLSASAARSRITNRYLCHVHA